MSQGSAVDSKTSVSPSVRRHEPARIENLIHAMACLHSKIVRISLKNVLLDLSAFDGWQKLVKNPTTASAAQLRHARAFKVTSAAKGTLIYLCLTGLSDMLRHRDIFPLVTCFSESLSSIPTVPHAS